MHLSEILNAELAKLRGRSTAFEGNPLDILETGTIRNTGENYRVNDGWSTLTFAEDVAECGGSLTAIDLDVSAAQEVIRAHELERHVTFHQGHSIDVLSGILANAYGNAKKNSKGQLILGGVGFVDVAFLDSDNDAGLILHEYLLVNRIMRSPGLIMVDDVDLTSEVVMKGHGLVPWLAARGIPYRTEIRHGDGYQTGVLVIEV